MVKADVKLFGFAWCIVFFTKQFSLWFYAWCHVISLTETKIFFFLSVVTNLLFNWSKFSLKRVGFFFSIEEPFNSISTCRYIFCGSSKKSLSYRNSFLWTYHLLIYTLCPFTYIQECISSVHHTGNSIVILTMQKKYIKSTYELILCKY